MYKRKKLQYEYVENRNFLINKQKERDDLMNEDLEAAKIAFDEELQRKREEMEQNMEEGNPNESENMEMNNEENHEGNEEKEGEEVEKEDPNVFNEKKWKSEWLADKSLIEIPAEIVLDLDEDIEMDIEELLGNEGDGSPQVM